MKKIDEWLKKFFRIGAGEDTERFVVRKRLFSPNSFNGGDKKYINPNETRTEMKKIDAWLKKFLGIGRG